MLLQGLTFKSVSARAKAEAARAQLAFAKKEAEMMKEEAYIAEEAARKKAKLTHAAARKSSCC